jgi:maleate cis-trans isomerase
METLSIENLGCMQKVYYNNTSNLTNHLVGFVMFTCAKILNKHGRLYKNDLAFRLAATYSSYRAYGFGGLER